MEMNQYLEIFIDETREHLQLLNQNLLELEKDPNNISYVNEIFRVAHTLKGMSGTMGFTKMSKLTHAMEDVLHGVRSGTLKITTKIVDMLFEGLDTLEKYLENIVNESVEGELENSELMQGLKQVLGGTSDSSTNSAPKKEVAKKELNNTEASKFGVNLDQYEKGVAKKALEQRMNVFAIKISINPGCVLKAARAFILFQTLERYTEIIKSVPSVTDIEEEKFDSEIIVVVVSAYDAAFLEKEIKGIAEIDDVKLEQIKNVDDSESETEQAESQQKAVQEDVALKSKSTQDKTQESDVGKVQAAKSSKTVRVDIERLDLLMNLVSELIIIKTRLDGFEIKEVGPEYDEALEYLERITTSLHDAVMKVRMVPVESVFNRFPRMIRDIAKDLNKEINLTMSGHETELDRTVIDEIGDPLIHLLRNSADHGIESVERRLKAGKPKQGNINLRAYQDGNNVIIEVEDDGGGIDIEKVRNKIVEKELLTREEANRLSKNEVIDYLFKPSFSTADKVTNLSGRGVGLDVVKTKIEAIGGTVDVDTELGRGTRFIISLPLTLAIIQALLVAVGNEKYAIPASSIKQIVRVSNNDIVLVQKQEMISVRDMMIPVKRLGEVLNVPNFERDKKQHTVIIAKKGDKLSGLAVDYLLGQQEIVIKSVGKLLSSIKSLAGATILGDGNVALILDINNLV